MSVIPNQSYLAKQMQYHMAAALARVMWDLGANCKGNAGAWTRNPNESVYTPSGWRKDNQAFNLKKNGEWARHGNKTLCRVTFTNARFDPMRGRIVYGEKRLGQNLRVQDDGKAKIIRNNSDSAVHVAYEESVDVTNSFSSSVTKGVSLDMTAEVGVESKVSGGYAGVSAEVTVSASFGISKSQSREESREASQEGTRSESLAIEFDASPRSHYLVSISKEHATTYQDFSIHGVMDFDVEMFLNINSPKGAGSRHSSHRPASTIKLVGMDAFEQFVHGYDTDYPKMEGFYNSCYWDTRKAIDWLMDPKNRFISVSGTNTASLESNASYAVEALGDAVPDALAHLPTVDAANV